MSIDIYREPRDWATSLVSSFSSTCHLRMEIGGGWWSSQGEMVRKISALGLRVHLRVVIFHSIVDCKNLKLMFLKQLYRSLIKI